MQTKIKLLLTFFFSGVFCFTPAVRSSAQQNIPTPQSVFGFEVGADYQLIDYEQSVDYFKKLAAASNRIKIMQAGYTSYDRPWYYSVISTPENLAQLEQFRQANQRLAHPEELSEQEMKRIIEDQPVFVDINGGLHANEIAGSQHTIQLAYELVSKDEKSFRELFSKTILILWPTINPDGQDIVVNWYKEIKGTKYKNAPLHELYQKYVGHDNNRDGFMLNMQESRVLANSWRYWEPEILHVHHQNGTSSNYSDFNRIWFPPFAPPVGVHTPERMLREMNTLGMQMAMELDTRGLRGATHMGDGFDSYYLGYNDYMEMYHNIVAYWTEANGGGYAEPYYVSPDSVLKKIQTFRPRTLYASPWRGGWWRLRDQVDYMVGADYGLLKFAAGNRKDILYNRYMAGKEAIDSFGKEHNSYAYIIPKEQRDPMEAVKMLRRLAFLGIKISTLKSDASVGDKTYPAGTWVIPTNQEFAGLIEEMLGIQKYPEIEEYPGGPLEQPYDVAGWTVPYYMDVHVDRIEKPLSNEFTQSLTPVKGEAVPWESSKKISLLTNAVAAGIPSPQSNITGKGSALALNPAENNSYVLMNRALSDGGKVSYVNQGFDGGQGGYYVVSKIKKDLLQKWATELSLQARWTKTSGQDIKQLRIGIYAPWNASMDEGWTLWIFDENEFNYKRIRNAEMKAGDLNKNYDVIVFPSIGQGFFRGGRNTIIDGFSSEMMPEPYAGGIGNEGVEALKSFVENGGRLVCLNESSEFAINQFKLPVENVVRRLSSKDFFVGGSILEAMINKNERIMSGMPDKAKIFFNSSAVFKTGEGFKGSVLASYPQEGNILLSGYLKGENYLRGRAAALKAEYGKGDIVLFGFSPQWRGQTTGTFKALFNCLYGE
ncbi:MAG: hypothetical protein LC128_04945 [Chitinophagales bacterium]|nr:hypothetical protein [Chitinophagales bacterium]